MTAPATFASFEDEAFRLRLLAAASLTRPSHRQPTRGRRVTDDVDWLNLNRIETPISTRKAAQGIKDPHATDLSRVRLVAARVPGHS